MALAGNIELLPCHTAACTGDPALRVDLDVVKRREVDHHTSVADGVAGRVVTPTSNGDRESVAAGEVERGSDVARFRAANDHGRAPVDERVEGQPGGVVRAVGRGENLTAYRAGEI
jgi:hypothetical protein